MYKWKNKRYEEDYEPSYIKYDDPRAVVKIQPVKPKEREIAQALTMAKNYSTRSSTDILDNIHAIANQRYYGEMPSRTDDELGVYVSDILKRAAMRSASGPSTKDYYLSTSNLSDTEENEAEVEYDRVSDDVPSYDYRTSYDYRPSYEGYDVYLPVRSRSYANLYNDEGGEEEDEYSFILEPHTERRTQRKYRGAVSAPLWRSGEPVVTVKGQVNT